MYRKNHLTLIELVIVLGLIFIFLSVMFSGSGINRADQLRSQTNLSKIGKGLTSYALDVTKGYFPCEEGKDKTGKLNEKNWKLARESRHRSTYKTMQVLMDSDTEMKPEVAVFVSPIASEMQPPERRANGKYEKFDRNNIGYHYVNGTVSQRTLGQEKALMRDLNEGFDDFRCGYVLFANGSAKKVERQGSPSSDEINYRTNWYKNEDLIPNYKDFDTHSYRINLRKPDRVD